MKIQIQNLGAVIEGTVDLKPLTVFVGPNNTGKTWTAYAIAGMLGPFGVRRYAEAYVKEELDERYPEIDEAIDQLTSTGRSSVDLRSFIERWGEMYLNNVARHFVHRISDYLTTSYASFDNISLGIDPDTSSDSWINNVILFEATAKVGRTPDTEDDALLEGLKESGDPAVHFYTYARGNDPTEWPNTLMRKLVCEGIFFALHRSIYSHVRTFPTERTTFITLPLADRQTVESDKQDSFDSRDQIGFALPWPVGSFLAMQYSINRLAQASGLDSRSSDATVRRYVELAQVLETNILGGHLEFVDQPGNVGGHLTYACSDTIRLAMPVVSSMIKELAPLTLYLRYLAKPGELVVIDEPEMNLHPEAQVRLAELLAMLCNAGIYVLVTTHSPYFVDHLVNLMRAHASRENPGVVARFYLKSRDAFLDKSKVSVHLFENGSVKNAIDEDGLIDWGTFADVSDRVADIFYEV